MDRLRGTNRQPIRPTCERRHCCTTDTYTFTHTHSICNAHSISDADDFTDAHVITNTYVITYAVITHAGHLYFAFACRDPVKTEATSSYWGEMRQKPVNHTGLFEQESGAEMPRHRSIACALP